MAESYIEESFGERVKIARKVFVGGMRTLDETVAVKEVTNESTELSNGEKCGSSSSRTGESFQFNNCTFSNNCTFNVR